MLASLILLLTLVIGVLVVARLMPLRLARFAISISRRLLGLSRREVAIDGINLVYLEGGQGEPLVLLHGLGADKDNFLLVASKLRQQFRLIVPDLPGFGESGKPDDAGYSVPQQVARLERFLAALGIGRCHIGGNSMGGFIAAAYAAAHPGQVLSAWLLAPAGVKSAKPSELMNAIASGREAPILARSVREVRQLMRFVMHRPPFIPYFMLASIAHHQRTHYAHHQQIIQELVAGPSLEELLVGNPKVPTLIVWGDRDCALDSSGAEILMGFLPQSQLLILRNVGHVPMMEAPGKVVADYLAFHGGLSVA